LFFLGGGEKKKFGIKEEKNGEVGKGIWGGGGGGDVPVSLSPQQNHLGLKWL